MDSDKVHAVINNDICNNNTNNDNEMLIKSEPLVYTRAWHAVQKTTQQKHLD